MQINVVSDGVVKMAKLEFVDAYGTDWTVDAIDATRYYDASIDKVVMSTEDYTYWAQQADDYAALIGELEEAGVTYLQLADWIDAQIDSDVGYAKMRMYLRDYVSAHADN